MARNFQLPMNVVTVSAMRAPGGGSSYSFWFTGWRYPGRPVGRRPGFRDGLMTRRSRGEQVWCAGPGRTAGADDPKDPRDQATLEAHRDPRRDDLDAATPAVPRRDPVVDRGARPEVGRLDQPQLDVAGLGPVVSLARPDAAEHVGSLGHLGPGVAALVQPVELGIQVRPPLGASVAEIGQCRDEPFG